MCSNAFDALDIGNPLSYFKLHHALQQDSDVLFHAKPLTIE